MKKRWISLGLIFSLLTCSCVLAAEDTSEEESNLALNKTVTVSAEGLGLAEGLTDGDPNTYWGAEEGDTDAWVMVDLEQEQLFNRIGVDELYGGVKSFQITASSDSTNWKTIYSGTGMGMDFVAAMDDTRARYIRISMTGNTGGNIALDALNVYYQQTFSATGIFGEESDGTLYYMVGSPTVVYGNVSTQIDDDPSVTPILIDGEPYVPVISVFDIMGARTGYNRQTGEAAISFNGSRIELSETSYTVDGVVHEMPEPTVLYLGNLYVSADTAAQILECKLFVSDNGLIAFGDLAAVRKMRQSPLWVSEAEGFLNTAAQMDAESASGMEVITYKYADIREWAKAGLTAEGKAYRDSAQEKAELSGDMNETQIQAVIDQVAAQGGGVITVHPGTYTLNAPIYMKDGVVLRGEEDKKSETLFAIDYNITDYNSMTNAITFDGVKNAGVENLTIRYVYLEPLQPQKNWYYNITDGFVGSISLNGTDCWLYNNDIINSGCGIISVSGSHNHMKGNYIDGAYNKEGGAAYYTLGGTYNLMEEEEVHNIRHISLQLGSQYDVITNCYVTVDFNYHNGDSGHNLITNNKAPADSAHWWGNVSRGVPGMHAEPGRGNLFYKNDMTWQGESHYSDPDIIYEATTFAESEVAAPKYLKPGAEDFELYDPDVVYPQLDNLLVNGEQIEGFDPITYQYSLPQVDGTTEMPKIEAVSEQYDTYVKYPVELPGKAYVYVNDKEDPLIENIYEIDMTYLPPTWKLGDSEHYKIAAFESTGSDGTPASNNSSSYTEDEIRIAGRGPEVTAIVDFGEVKTLGALALNGVDGTGAGPRTANYDVYVSDDKVTWRPLLLDQWTDNRTMECQIVEVGPVDTRYVKIVGKGSDGGLWFAIAQCYFLPPQGEE